MKLWRPLKVSAKKLCEGDYISISTREKCHDRVKPVLEHFVAASDTHACDEVNLAFTFNYRAYRRGQPLEAGPAD